MKQFVLFFLAASVLAVPMPPVNPPDPALDGSGNPINSEVRFQENRARIKRWLSQPTAEESTSNRIMALSAEFGVMQTAERAAVEAFIQTNAFGWTETITNQDGSISWLDSIWQGQPRYIAPLNITAARTTRTDALWPGGASGLELDGAGGEVALWEISDPLLTHREFTTNGVSGRRIFDLDGPSSRQKYRNHATHVSGTLGALGLQPRAKGMAYRVDKILAGDQEMDLCEMPAFFAANAYQLSNHSYGYNYGWGGGISPEGFPVWWGDLAISAVEDYHFGLYDDRSLCVDRIAYECVYYLPVWAAGNERGSSGKPYRSPILGHLALSNGVPAIYKEPRPDDGGTDGYDTLSSHKLAKNALIVGAVETNLAISPFSSYGPADDGRVGISVCGMGVNVRSSGAFSDNHYYTGSGTSFASPNVAGSLALIGQLYQQRAGYRARSSTLRGLAIHTAREAGAHPGPDYRFGWGIFDAQAAGELTSANFSNDIPFIKEIFVPAADSDVEFPVTAVGGGPLKVTVVWTDPPPAALPPQRELDPPDRVLVHDFDLRLIALDGVTNLAWALDAAAPAAAAQKSGNQVDNVEQTVIENPASNAVYTLRIAHNGAMTQGQWLSVLLSGAVALEEPKLIIRELTQTGPDTFALIWPANPGRLYEVEQRDALDSDRWTPVFGGMISARKTTAAVEVSSGPADVRFYRILRNR